MMNKVFDEVKVVHKRTALIISGFPLFLPFLVFAQAPSPGSSMLDRFMANLYTYIFNPFLYLFMGLAVVVFLWGVIRFIVGGADEEAVTTGKRHMIWGIVGLFIIVSVWGIMNLICRTVGACY